MAGMQRELGIHRRRQYSRLEVESKSVDNGDYFNTVSIWPTVLISKNEKDLRSRFGNEQFINDTHLWSNNTIPAVFTWGDGT